MPFDFANNKTYTIDYKGIFNEIMEQKILSDRALQFNYLNQWITVLKQHDDILMEQFSVEERILEFAIKIQSEPEIFQLPIHWKSSTMFLHFRVTIANSIIKDYYSKSEDIPIDEFQGKCQSIYWTKVEENVERYAGNNTPIITVPYLSGKCDLLVIDGNHRITHALKNNISNIKTMIISEQSVIEQQIFSSSFDKLLYVFNNELCRFGNETMEGKNNDWNLIEKSYLCGKGFQFGE
jgi:hypothetical protein